MESYFNNNPNNVTSQPLHRPFSNMHQQNQANNALRGLDQSKQLTSIHSILNSKDMSMSNNNNNNANNNNNNSNTINNLINNPLLSGNIPIHPDDDPYGAYDLWTKEKERYRLRQQQQGQQSQSQPQHLPPATNNNMFGSPLITSFPLLPSLMASASPPPWALEREPPRNHIETKRSFKNFL